MEAARANSVRVPVTAALLRAADVERAVKVSALVELARAFACADERAVRFIVNNAAPAARAIEAARAAMSVRPLLMLPDVRD
jgi:hypothetical protein